MNKPIVILGGGLWGGLLAYRLKMLHPQQQIVLLEGQSKIGGNHTWSFHGSDVSAESLVWLKPFLKMSWEGYTVNFPGFSREFNSHYHAISSEQFNEIITNSLGESVRLNQVVSLQEAQTYGSYVIDARGKFNTKRHGYQKFVGLEVELESPHNLDLPILMDAKVSQFDGYRFLYYLPFTPTTVLVEDTRYSKHPSLDEREIQESIMNEISRRDWVVKNVIRKEIGVLPIPLEKIRHSEYQGSIDLAGILHDTTGYSFPDAVRLVELIVQTDLSKESVIQCVSKYRQVREKDRGFFRLLNLLMFEAARDNERYRVFQHFYKLPNQLIARFYQGNLSLFERLRIFTGKPPVKITSAVRSICRKVLP